MNKFLQIARVFNTLIPMTLCAIFLAGLGWVALKEISRAPVASPSVIGPGGSGERSQDTFRLRPARTAIQGDVVWLELVADKEGGSYEDGRGGEVRNLLALKPNGDQDRWLFPDQSLNLVGIRELTQRGDIPKALSIQAQLGDPTRTQDKINLFLARPDGSQLTPVLSGMDEVMVQTVHGEVLAVIYQKNGTVRAAMISLEDFRTLSDRDLAQVAKVGDPANR